MRFNFFKMSFTITRYGRGGKSKVEALPSKQQKEEEKKKKKIFPKESMKSERKRDTRDITRDEQGFCA